MWRGGSPRALGLARRASGAGDGTVGPSSPGLRSLARQRVASSGRGVPHPGGCRCLGRHPSLVPGARLVAYAPAHACRRATEVLPRPSCPGIPPRPSDPAHGWAVTPRTAGRPCQGRGPRHRPRRGRRPVGPHGRVTGSTGLRQGSRRQHAGVQGGWRSRRVEVSAPRRTSSQQACGAAARLQRSAPGASRRPKLLPVVPEPDASRRLRPTPRPSHPPSALAQRQSREGQEAEAGGRWYRPWLGLVGGGPSAAVWGVRDLTKHWSRPRQWELVPMRQSVHGAAAHRGR